MKGFYRVELGTKLQQLADELAPDIQMEYIEAWLAEIDPIIDAALKAARVEGMIKARNSCMDLGVNHVITVEAINELIEAEHE